MIINLIGILDQSTLCNIYCMIRSALWNIKYPTPRTEPEGEGLYIPECMCVPCNI